MQTHLKHTLRAGLIAAQSTLPLWMLPPAFAQDQSSTSASLSQGDVSSAASKALRRIKSAGADKLLVRDLLGAKVTEPGGSVIGTVEDLAVVPGGRIIAAIVATKASDLGRVPVPFAAVKVSHKAGKIELDLPLSLSEIKNMKQVQSLTKALPGL